MLLFEIHLSLCSLQNDENEGFSVRMTRGEGLRALAHRNNS